MKGINLTKYRFSKHENTPKQINDKKVKVIGTKETSILGINYDPTLDTFVIRVTKWGDNTIVTKQNVYSYLSKRYDVCGFIEALKLQFKLEYHRLKYPTFEEEIPKRKRKRKSSYRLPNEYKAYHLTRYTGEPTEFMVMSDASDKAWGVVIYGINERHQLDIYRSKSKLLIFANTQASIPRAEL